MIPEEIRSPLRVAQWVDYWPRSLLSEFVDYVSTTYGKSLQIVWDAYYTNEELLDWIGMGRSYDVIFPTQHALELLKTLGFVRPLRPDWIPNLVNLFPEFQRPAWAVNRLGDLFAAPYMAGTTGLGFRTDKGWSAADMEALGWDALWVDTIAGVSIVGRKEALADPRDLVGMGLKKAGWDWQVAQGLPPTGEVPPEGIQWTLSESDASRLLAAREALLAARPGWSGVTTSVAQDLAAGSISVGQVWSVDALHAIEPYRSSRPVEFIHPKQGFHRWVDSAAIPTFSENVYTAHLFIDYLLRGDVAKKVADWNLGATPNAAAWDLLGASPSGYDPREDLRIYPDAETLRRADVARTLPIDAQTAYRQIYFAVL